MNRNTTPSFVLIRPLVDEIYVNKNLEKKFKAANRLYNNGVKHCQKHLQLMQNNEEYMQTLQKYRKEKNSKGRKALSGQLSSFCVSYGLTENEIQKYLSKPWQNTPIFYKWVMNAVRKDKCNRQDGVKLPMLLT